MKLPTIFISSNHYLVAAAYIHPDTDSKDAIHVYEYLCKNTVYMFCNLCSMKEFTNFHFVMQPCVVI